MLTVIEREKTKGNLKKDNKVFLLFSGVNHEWEGYVVSLDGVFNSAYAARQSIQIPYANWLDVHKGRQVTVIQRNGHVEGYAIIECEIGELSHVGITYDELFEDYVL